MPEKALQRHLADLHDELAAAGDLDPGLRRQLRDVADEIEALLGASQNAVTSPAEAQLQARIRRATVEFEADYPRLARVMSDVADTLTKLGI